MEVRTGPVWRGTLSSNRRDRECPTGEGGWDPRPLADGQKAASRRARGGRTLRVLADCGGVSKGGKTVEGKEGNPDPKEDRVSPTSTSNPTQPG